MLQVMCKTKQNYCYMKNLSILMLQHDVIVWKRCNEIFRSYSVAVGPQMKEGLLLILIVGHYLAAGLTATPTQTLR